MIYPRVEAGMVHAKPHLPTKVCMTCARPFAWRKKWARDWAEVKFCSERCRRAGKSVTPAGPPS